MRTCYLHLGMPKTGSSSIQAAFHGFQTPTLAYAALREKNHGLPLAAAFATDPATVREFRWRETPPEEIAETVARMKAQIDAACRTRKSVIFSGEAVIDQLKPAEFARLVATMRQHFDRVVAIAYVRPLAALAASQMQQRIRMGLGKFQLPPPDYRRRFEPVIDSIGRDDCILVRFDRADLHGSDIVTDFAHRLGLDRAPKSDVVTNESLSSEALGALYAFNRFTGPLLRSRDRTRMRREMELALRDVGTTKFGLDPALVREHVAKYAEDIAWIEQVCGFELSGEVKPVPHPIRTGRQLLDLAARFAEGALAAPPRKG